MAKLQEPGRRVMRSKAQTKAMSASNKCWPGEHLALGFLMLAVMLGQVVNWVLTNYTTKFDLPDIPEGTKETVQAMIPTNLFAFLMWVCLIKVAKNLRSENMTFASLSASCLITAFWLASLIACVVLERYFEHKKNVWPNIGLEEGYKEGVHLHTFEELKVAQKASAASAGLSFFVVVLWVVVTRYRYDDWRLVRHIQDSVSTPQDVLDEQADVEAPSTETTGTTPPPAAVLTSHITPTTAPEHDMAQLV